MTLFPCTKDYSLRTRKEGVTSNEQQPASDSELRYDLMIELVQAASL